MQFESRSVSRILFSDLWIGAATIHLAHPLPDGSSDLPGGRETVAEPFQARRTHLLGRAALLTPPYLVLHCEEFAWPRRVTTRAGALLH